MAIYTEDRDPNVIQLKKEMNEGKSFWVTINWSDRNGNPRSTNRVIKSNSIHLALTKIENSVRKFKSFFKLHGGSAKGNII